jgi:hypothetical protein
MFTKKFKYSLIRTIVSPCLPLLVRFYTRLIKIETSGEERVRRNAGKRPPGDPVLPAPAAVRRHSAIFPGTRPTARRS